MKFDLKVVEGRLKGQATAEVNGEKREAASTSAGEVVAAYSPFAKAGRPGRPVQLRAEVEVFGQADAIGNEHLDEALDTAARFGQVVVVEIDVQ